MQQRPHQRKKIVQRIVIALIFAALIALAAPIATYIYKFGWSITADHTRWSEMGSAFGGIYAPILSVLTLVLLMAQVRLQARMHDHDSDQSFIQDARSDIHFYLSELAKEFSAEFDDGSEVGTMLINSFGYATPSELASDQFKQTADALNRRNHRLLAMWMAFNGVLSSLRVNDYPPYSNNLEIAKLKASMMLSYPGCVALDNYMWCVTRGRFTFGPEFATRSPGQQ